MAIYQAIPDTALDPESPIDAELMFRLRDNPLAIASADATAPRVQARATGGSALASEDGVYGCPLRVTADDSPDGVGKLVRPVPAPAHSSYPVITPTAGDQQIAQGNTAVLGSIFTSSTTFQTAVTITIHLYSGTLRFRAIFNSATTRVRKNGTVLETWSGHGARMRDIPVVPGDVITWQHTEGSYQDHGEWGNTVYVFQPEPLQVSTI